MNDNIYLKNKIKHLENKVNILIIFIVLLMLFIVYNSFKTNTYLDSHNIITSYYGNNTKINDTGIAYMLETGSGTGVYEQSNNTTWPSSGYSFNSTKSACENGSLLTFDNSSHQLTINSSKTDKCYVYFDYAKNTATITLGSTSLTISSGTGTISYTYNGDGILSCSPTAGSYSSCSVDTTNHLITFTSGSSYGTDTYYLMASETALYYSATSQAITLTYAMCLSEDTMVCVWDRKKKKKIKKRIKDIVEGDIVYSYDAVKNAFVTSIVKNLSINTTKQVCKIYVKNDIITTTLDHPFYVQNLGYIEACLLTKGAKILGLDNKYYIVDDIEIESLNEDKKMYSIVLDKDATSFMVGEYGLVCLSMFVCALTAMIIDPEIVSAYG